MRWSLVERIFSYWVLFNFIRIDASTQNTHESLYTYMMRTFDHIVIYSHILLKKLDLIVHICKQATHNRSKMDNNSWLDSLKQIFCLTPVSQVSVLPLSKEEFHILIL